MTSRDFCYWLQGFFEIEEAKDEGSKQFISPMTATQVKTIQRHLALVFKHEIDPSEPGDPEENQAIHDGKPPANPAPPFSNTDTLIRC